MNTKRNKWLLLLYIGFVAIAGLVLILWITPFGPGTSPSSAIFIGGAKNLLSGKGFSINGAAITHDPPLYTLLLAAMGLFTSNFMQAARILNAILFGVNIGLVALAVYLEAGRNFLTTTLAALIFLSSAEILYLHSMALSEPLFFALCLASIILLWLYVKTPTLPLLIASSLTLGLATITRYIGAAFIPAALIIVFVEGSGQKFSRRFRNTFIWLVLACTPLLAFFIKNTVATGMATDRTFVFHRPIMSHYIKGIYTTLFNFIVPIKLPGGVRPAFLGLSAIFLIALLIILFKRRLRAINWRSMGIIAPLSSLLFSVFYLLFLYISISFFDANTPVADKRILSPVFLLLVVGAFPAMWAASQTLKKPIVWWGFLFFIVLFISLNIPNAMQSARTSQENGLGYTTKQWVDSESITFVKSLGKNTKMYSNGADVLSLVSEKETSFVPYKMDPTSRKKNPLYDAEIKAMCKDIKENGALLVYFNLIKKQYFPTKAELISKCHLPVLQTFTDGTVYSQSY